MITSMQRFEVYSTLFSSEQGKAFLHDFLDLTGVFKQSFSSNDPHQTAFNEGMRHAGSLLMQIVDQSPEVLSKTIQQVREAERFHMIQQQEDNLYND